MNKISDEQIAELRRQIEIHKSGYPPMTRLVWDALPGLLDEVVAQRAEIEHRHGLESDLNDAKANIGVLRAHIDGLRNKRDIATARAEAAEARVRELDILWSEASTGWAKAGIRAEQAEHENVRLRMDNSILTAALEKILSDADGSETVASLWQIYRHIAREALSAVRG